MDAVQALIELGGVATGGEIVAQSSRRKLRTAVGSQRISRVARNSYMLPLTEFGAAAARLNGLISHASAAAHWGWKTKIDDWRPHVTVPRGRKVAPAKRCGVHLHWKTLAAAEVAGRVTTRVRTVIDCAGDLPFDEALAIADSALRSGEVSRAELVTAAPAMKGRNAATVRRVVEHADGRSMNPFESVLRALAISAGLLVTPQFPIRIPGAMTHPDLVDEGRRLVLEADSWGFHASREAHDADCLRYTLLVTAGWTVLRFTWPQVMHHPEWVSGVLRSWAATTTTK
ncbi:MAG: DUF559 domain-containing protein [Nocardioides sp.]|nr:DUF559 domain-containing protein [Nocardioides sp.]